MSKMIIPNVKQEYVSRLAVIELIKQYLVNCELEKRRNPNVHKALNDLLKEVKELEVEVYEDGDN